MPRTARDLIKDAGVTAGVISPIESFTGAEVVDALTQLNNILEQFNLDKHFPPYKFVERVTTTGDSFTIGPDPSADLEMARPNIITSVAYVLGSVERPLRNLPQDDYDNYSKFQASAGYPDYYVVRTSYPLMEIELYPKLAGNLDVVVTGETTLGDWTLDTIIELPNGYAPALEYKLAEILALRNGNISYELIKAQAQDFLDRVKRINNKGRLVSKRGSLQTRGDYDVYSDSYGGL